VPATEEPTEPPTATVPEPTPSATPDKLPPIIDDVSFDVPQVPLGGVANFEVFARDPDDPSGDTLTYAWSASWGAMLDADQRKATFHALGNMSGMDLTVTVTVRVTDAQGNWTEKDTTIDVVPRVVDGPRR